MSIKFCTNLQMRCPNRRRMSLKDRHETEYSEDPAHSLLHAAFTRGTMWVFPPLFSRRLLDPFVPSSLPPSLLFIPLWSRSLIERRLSFHRTVDRVRMIDRIWKRLWRWDRSNSSSLEERIGGESEIYRNREEKKL